MTDVTCHHCGLINDYKVIETKLHHTAYCNGCERFIKHVPHSTDTTIWFGKYKGEGLADIFEKDAGYINWLYKMVVEEKKIKLKQNQIDVIKEFLHK